MKTTTFTLNAVSFGYSDTHVLHDINLTFEPGQLYGIVGPNGSGKSTLLDVLTGHQAPSSGSVTINTSPVASIAPADRARQFALVPQDVDFNFPFTLFETVLMGRHPHIQRFAHPSQKDVSIVETAIHTMDLSPLKGRIVADLSGGERQRTVVARGLAQTTSALLLDEPTSSMDIRHALTTMTELQRLASEENRTIIAVLHDLNLAAAFCDQIVILNKGRVHAHGTVTKALTSEILNAVFRIQAEIFTTDTGVHIFYKLKDHS
ncbi:ATP-binding cassette domain-containing protein [Pseudodesulfovibrio sp. JC047]|uniref:ABC transporter ATP-binding protein n=1 Tax=Pseudodesulfovibrio sp. JC047 TaxID=2683199 RepID=UPI0013D8D01E|nr:ABC transporter ATP-binding protein [Pseudodesulfovibrio sp. JC047]NDV17986.1 ATP-binding cassette domain-containing protein [Pseudodesulfovibrio sp. JC047]